MLRGLPISSVLNCALELWRNLQIDDDELLEITIRDVSYQIQLQKEREEGDNTDSSDDSTTLTRPIPETLPSSRKKRQMDDVSIVSSFESYRRRFNPRQDPTGKINTFGFSEYSFVFPQMPPFNLQCFILR